MYLINSRLYHHHYLANYSENLYVLQLAFCLGFSNVTEPNGSLLDWSFWL